MSPFGVRAGPFYAGTGRTGCGSVLAAIFVLALMVGLVVVYWQAALLIGFAVTLVVMTVRSMRRKP